MSAKCIACGMPMTGSEDHAMADATRDYCVHCARPDGSMQSYEEKLDSLAGFMVRTQGLDVAAARTMAVERMADLPAWRDRPGPEAAGRDDA
jgi:hypothetical protein